MMIPLQAEHIAACARIMSENALWQRYGVTRAQAETVFTDGLHDHDARIQVAIEGGLVQGFVWYYQRGTFGSGAYIKLLGVDNAYHGQGIGAALLTTAENAIIHHTRDVFLLASDFNTGAQRFYRRSGYQAIGTLPDYVLAGVAEVLFWKRLAIKGGVETKGHHTESSI